MGRIDFDLYLITDRHHTGGRPLLEVLSRAFEAGVRAVQIREKDLGGRELLSLASSIRSSIPGARLFVNDRVDVALAASADGVHLGQQGIPVRAVRERFRDILIGASTHSLDEALRAEEEGADFVTFGPVFYTPSKAPYGPPLGVERLKKVTERVGIPVFAIGGIKRENVKEVIDAGAHGVALISAIMEAPCVEDAARGIISEIKRSKKGEDHDLD